MVSDIFWDDHVVTVMFIHPGKKGAVNVSHSQKTNQWNCPLSLAAFVQQIFPGIVFVALENWVLAALGKTLSVDLSVHSMSDRELVALMKTCSHPKYSFETANM